MTKCREIDWKFPEFTPEQLKRRWDTVFIRKDFYPNDYARISDLRLNGEKYGDTPEGAMTNALAKQYRTQPPTEVAALIDIYYQSNISDRASLITQIHTAMQNHLSGEPNQEIVKRLTELGNEITRREETARREKALKELQANSEKIRREAIHDIMCRIGVRESQASVYSLPKQD